MKIGAGQIRVVHRDLVEHEAQRLAGKCLLYACMAGLCTEAWARNLAVSTTWERGVSTGSRDDVELCLGSVLAQVGRRGPLHWRAPAWRGDVGVGDRYAHDWRGLLAIEVAASVAQAIAAAGFARLPEPRWSIGPVWRELFRLLRRGFVDNGAYLLDVAPRPPWISSEFSTVSRLFDVEAAAERLRQLVVATGRSPGSGRALWLGPYFVPSDHLTLAELDIRARLDQAMASTPGDVVQAQGLLRWIHTTLGAPEPVFVTPLLLEALDLQLRGDLLPHRILRAWARLRLQAEWGWRPDQENRLGEDRAGAMAAELEEEFVQLLPSGEDVAAAERTLRRVELAAAAPSRIVPRPWPESERLDRGDRQGVADRMVRELVELARQLALVPPGWEPVPGSFDLDDDDHDGVWHQRVPVEDVGPVTFSEEDWEGELALRAVGAMAAAAGGSWAVAEDFGTIPSEFTALTVLRRHYVSTGAYLRDVPLPRIRDPLVVATKDLANALSRAVFMGRAPKHIEGLRAWEVAAVKAYLGEVLPDGIPSAPVTLQELALAIDLPGINSWSLLAENAASAHGPRI